MCCLLVIDVLFISDNLQTFRIWFERICMTQRNKTKKSVATAWMLGVNDRPVRSELVLLTLSYLQSR
jgi:hypothetical protein